MSMKFPTVARPVQVCFQIEQMRLDLQQKRESDPEYFAAIEACAWEGNPNERFWPRGKCEGCGAETGPTPFVCPRMGVQTL